jgi:WD40 repeat protein
MPDLAVVVAGLNSTMAESHQDSDHYGWVGEHQLRWFADRLAGHRERGWLRLAAVHHNVVRGAVLDDENLHDADDLDRWLGLGQPGAANLLLHGHTHDGRLHRLPSGLIALSTGSAAVTAEARPREVANQYQLVTIRPDGFTRQARQYAPGQRRWIGDNRVSRSGSDWREHEDHPFANIGATFAVGKPGPDGRPADDRSAPSGRLGDGFFDRVIEATRVAHPNATVTPRPERRYLRVTDPLEGGSEQWPVGIVEGAITAADIDDFVTGVHAEFAAHDPFVRSELVHGGPPATAELVATARQRGVRLRSFIDYQGLLDLRPLAAKQADRLADDQIYPARLYIAQRYRLLDDPADAAARDGLLDQVVDWLGHDTARFVMVLGDFGRGKTFLLRQLARALPERLPGALPVLVELRSLEKAPSLDGLLAQHLVEHGVEDISPAKLRYMIRSGRLALLFDGFDELELRVGYDNAADYLRTLLEAVTERAKVVLTSRTQHFQSTAQVRTALGDRVAAMATSRVAVVADFTDDQILAFLTNHFGGDRAAAQARRDLLADVEDLLGLSRNPRMLSFIADLDEDRLRAIQRERGRISAAGLYAELVDFWLVGEADRQRHRGSVTSLDERERLAACEALALKLWASMSSAIPAADLSAAVAARLSRLAERGYSADQAAHAVGSGTLLVRTDDGAFAFGHQSIMEWLVADAAAKRCRAGQPADALAGRRLSRLMAAFFCDIAGREAARRWASETLADPAASEVAKQNALAVSDRVGAAAARDLAGVDLRDQDLGGQDLRGANLRGANLRGMRLAGIDLTDADLTEADLTGVRMTGGSLRGTVLAGSQWRGAALLGVAGVDDPPDRPELAAAALAGRDPAVAVLSSGGEASYLAFAPDGDLLAISSAGAVELVDTADGHTVRVLTGHTGEVRGVAFSPDCAQLAAGSYNGTARIWDTATGTARAILEGHTGPVRGVAFSPDGTHLATASEDNTARIWDTATGAARAILEGHSGPVRGVAFSSDGAQLASASYSTICIWDVASGAAQATLKGHTGWVEGVVFSPDGAQLAAAYRDGTTCLWDIATGIGRAIFARHTSLPPNVAFSADCAQLAIPYNDGTTYLCDVATGTIRTISLELHTGQVGGVALSPDGAQLATCANGTARIWDTATGTARATLKGYPSRVPQVRDVAFSPDGAQLATASADGTARIWNAATGTASATLEGHTAWVLGVAFSPDGAQLATASDDRTARLWDTATGTARATLEGHSKWVRCVAFSPDGTQVATTSTDCTARIWDTATGTTRATLEGHTSWVESLAFSPDGAQLATASNDARLWDVATGTVRLILEGHTGVEGVAYSPDGAQLATAFADGIARLWDAATGTARRTLEGHTSAVLGVAFSPDGAQLATASADATARLWDVATGTARRTLEGHTSVVRSVAFSPDGAQLATASADGTVRLWDTADGRCLATLVALPNGGYAVLLPDGSYKLAGDPGQALWWAIKLCRFAPGELDPYIPEIRRLPAEAPILPH